MGGRTRCFWLAVAGALGLGCSSSESSPTTGDIPAAFCKKVAECASVSMQFVYGDEETCRARLALAINAGLAASSGANTGACAAGFAGQNCDDFLSKRNSGPSACHFKGTGTNGSACGTDWQCSSGICNFTGVCGVCADPLKSGDDCTSGRCGEGLTCSGTSKCVAPGLGGSTCKTGSECDTAFSCVGGTCASRVGAGAACASDGTKPGCTTGYYCGSSNVCTTFKLANLGESCGVNGSDYIFCKGSYCKTSGAGPSGTCAAYAADGAACGTGNAQCQSPAACTSGVCKLRDPAACK